MSFALSTGRKTGPKKSSRIPVLHDKENASTSAKKPATRGRLHPRGLRPTANNDNTKNSSDKSGVHKAARKPPTKHFSYTELRKSDKEQKERIETLEKQLTNFRRLQHKTEKQDKHIKSLTARCKQTEQQTVEQIQYWTEKCSEMAQAAEDQIQSLVKQFEEDSQTKQTEVQVLKNKLLTAELKLEHTNINPVTMVSFEFAGDGAPQVKYTQDLQDRLSALSTNLTTREAELDAFAAEIVV